ncbi:MAG: hypothetical protein SCI25_15690 [Desulfuromonadales bacterium]|nr:hypothetical protein [Desulfuromonadales bacterium]
MDLLSGKYFSLLKSFSGLFLCATLMALAGCVSSPISLSEEGSLAQGEGIVAGSVRLLDEGEEKGFSSVFGESLFGLFVTGPETSAATYVPLKGEGDFIWHLPGGEYQITGFEWRSGLTISGPIGAKFRVVSGEAAYIGTLVMSFYGGRYVVNITDEMESTADRVSLQFPALKGKITKDVMTLEERR